MRATVIATSNIALVKYWGKRDEILHLPVNSSISFTLDEQLRTETTIEFSGRFSRDAAVVNGKGLEVAGMKELLRPLKLIREFARTGEHFRLVSKNYFPTGAGLASSASAYAALVVAADAALELGLTKEQLSMLARIGSGSASRSIYGGFVEWRKGKRSDGLDSVGVQLAPPKHWPQIRDVIGIVEEGHKKIRSRAGMKQTVQTSGLYASRMAMIEERLRLVKYAIAKKKLGLLLRETMRDSNSMHATMLDTWPPIMYLTDASREIISAVHEFNGEDEPRIGYTFDAGPNAHLITVEKYVPQAKKLLKSVDGLKRIIVSKVGGGPRVLR